MSEFYNPDQLEVLVPFLPRPPKWLILGGPADANEAQTAARLWPGVRILGIEPNPEAVAFQQVNGWPADAVLVEQALDGESNRFVLLAVLEPSRLRNATTSAAHVHQGKARWGATVVREIEVPTVTLDQLDLAYGPFEDAVLWLDVEGAEAAALRGAKALLARRAFMAANVELAADDPGHAAVLDLLAAGGLRPAKDWNVGPLYLDRIYVREET